MEDFNSPWELDDISTTGLKALGQQEPQMKL